MREHSTGKRLSDAQKKGILVVAKQGGLTGTEFAKKFGIATLTLFWGRRWNAPRGNPGPSIWIEGRRGKV